MEKTETLRRLRRCAAFFMLNEKVLPRISSVRAHGWDGRKVLRAELVFYQWVAALTHADEMLFWLFVRKRAKSIWLFICK
jgi:hypothetical protein